MCIRDSHLGLSSLKSSIGKLFGTKSATDSSKETDSRHLHSVMSVTDVTTPTLISLVPSISTPRGLRSMQVRSTHQVLLARVISRSGFPMLAVPTEHRQTQTQLQ